MFHGMSSGVLIPLLIWLQHVAIPRKDQDLWTLPEQVVLIFMGLQQ